MRLSGGTTMYNTLPLEIAMYNTKITTHSCPPSTIHRVTYVINVNIFCGRDVNEEVVMPEMHPRPCCFLYIIKISRSDVKGRTLTKTASCSPLPVVSSS